MSDLGKHQGLVRRKGTWYYRVRVPSDLVSRFGTEKWQGFRTGDCELALERHAEQVAIWQAAFTQARRERPASSPTVHAVAGQPHRPGRSGDLHAAIAQVPEAASGSAPGPVVTRRRSSPPG
ncbi:MAG: DUF6538 domain-containing protein [Bauldia sp.]